MNEIKSTSGRVLGQWDGKNVKELMKELARIKQELIKEGSKEVLDSRMMPHRDQLHPDLLAFKAYHLWGCDSNGECLVGTNANRIETVEKVLSFSLIDHH